MNFVEMAARQIEGDPTATDMEMVCRAAIAAKMRKARRFLMAEEIEDVVEDIVSNETAIDPEDHVEDGELRVTDVEWESVPEEDKVEVEIDGEVVEGMVIGGRFRPARVSKDASAKRYASRINLSMQEQAHIAETMGVAPRALYNPVPDVNMPCPRCASRNVTPVWYDKGEVIACCNECGREFDASVNEVARATLAERTVEDVDILPEHDVFGSVWCNESGSFGNEIYASGDLVESGEEDDFEDIQEHFDDFADAYDEISEGSEIDFPNGVEERVEDVDGDILVLESGRRASRARVARMASRKEAFVDNSDAKGAIMAGAVFEKDGCQYVVTAASGDKVELECWEPMADGRVSHRQVSFTQGQARRFLL